MTSSSIGFSPRPKKNQVSEFSAEPSSLVRISKSMRTMFDSKRGAAWRWASAAVLSLATGSGCFADVQFEPDESASTGGTVPETSTDAGESGAASGSGSTADTVESTSSTGSTDFDTTADPGTLAAPPAPKKTTESTPAPSPESDSPPREPPTKARRRSSTSKPKPPTPRPDANPAKTSPPHSPRRPKRQPTQKKDPWDLRDPFG